MAKTAFGVSCRIFSSKTAKNKVYTYYEKGASKMDIAAMKQDFYKRFEESGSYLKQEKCGLLCTLLGFPDIEGALSLTYPLSVGVTGLCRPSASDKLQLENTDSDTVYTQRIKNTGGLLPPDTHISGEQILLDNSIPRYFDSTAETACCTVKCIMSINGFSRYDKTAAAASCCGKSNIKPYLALLNARPGYCIRSDRLKTESLPLPLAGFKLIAIQMDKHGDHSADYKEIESEFEKVKSLYPHITAISELTQPELETAKHKLKSKSSYSRLSMILRDNERIRSVAEPLRRCRTSELFNQMNQSAKDFLQLWGLEQQEAMLLRSVLEMEGVRAARFWNKGVIAVVYEERVDYILSSVENAFKRTGKYEIKFCISK